MLQFFCQLSILPCAKLIFYCNWKHGNFLKVFHLNVQLEAFSCQFSSFLIVEMSIFMFQQLYIINQSKLNFRCFQITYDGCWVFTTLHDKIGSFNMKLEIIYQPCTLSFRNDWNSFCACCLKFYWQKSFLIWTQQLHFNEFLLIGMGEI